MNSWIKKLCGDNLTYAEMNEAASKIEPGSDGLFILPFGNGAERMFLNEIVGAHVSNIDLNKHSKAHIFQGGAGRHSFFFPVRVWDIMRGNGFYPSIIRAGRANLFLSNIFVECFVNATGVGVELYENDGSIGAALGAGVGAGIYKSYEDAFTNFKVLSKVVPTNAEVYNRLYEDWKKSVTATFERHRLEET